MRSRSSDTRAAPGPAPAPVPAGLVTRGAAALLDALILIAVGFVLELGVGWVRLIVAGPPFRFPEASAWLSGVLGWSLAVLYLAGAWALVGRTVGGLLMGVRVGDRRGRALGVVRALVRAVLGVSFPVGLLWVPFSRRRASLQDLVVGSAVRYEGG
ncbi:RDD family protein [Actinomycetota bacterium Odt1-20B]